MSYDKEFIDTQWSKLNSSGRHVLSSKSKVYHLVFSLIWLGTFQIDDLIYNLDWWIFGLVTGGHWEFGSIICLDNPNPGAFLSKGIVSSKEELVLWDILNPMNCNWYWSYTTGLLYKQINKFPLRQSKIIMNVT